MSSIEELARDWRDLQAEADAYPSRETRQTAEKARQRLARAAKAGQR